MQASQRISEMKNTGTGTRYCIDDYMQGMAMERRIKEEGLRWQRDAAASSLQTVGCSGDLKIARVAEGTGSVLDDGDGAPATTARWPAAARRTSHPYLSLAA